jgi:AraC family transcriptional regulator
MRVLEEGNVVGAAYTSARMRIELLERDWAAPTRFCTLGRENLLVLTLPPVSYESRIRFPEASDGYREIGAAFFRPAGFLVEAEGSGGLARSLRCTFSQEYAVGALHAEDPWQSDEIVRGCDLSASAVPAILQRMVAELREPDLAHGAAMETMLNMALVELIRFLGRRDASEAPRGRLTRPQLGLLKERIQCETLTPPSVSELAMICGVSERHLLRLFRDSTGDTVSHFIRRELIRRAKRLLKDSDMPLKQVAYHLGFTGPSSFTAAFRKATGVTPGCYRSQSRTISRPHIGAT